MASTSTITISKSTAPKPLTTRGLKSGFGRLAPSLRNWIKACWHTRDRTETLTEMRGHNPSGRVRKLLRAALAFRAFHAAIAVEMLLAIAYVWWCALSGRRDLLLHVAAASLIGEGVLVAANHGDCPLGGLQERLGDPPCRCSSWCSLRAPRRGQCRRWAPSPLPGLSYWQYAVQA